MDSVDGSITLRYRLPSVGLLLFGTERNLLYLNIILPLHSVQKMNKQPKLWEILSALLPIFIGLFGWVWNINTTVKEQAIEIRYLKEDRVELRNDIKEIKQTTQDILIKLENKENRRADAQREN